jgi:septal ring factor EnvC (AmiA/AmiB activator)
MKQENDELYAMVEEQEQKMKKLQDQLTQSENDYNSLKMVKMLEISDGDIEQSKAKIAKLIRDVNKCITILKQ